MAVAGAAPTGAHFCSSVVSVLEVTSDVLIIALSMKRMAALQFNSAVSHVEGAAAYGAFGVCFESQHGRLVQERVGFAKPTGRHAVYAFGASVVDRL